MAWKGVRSFGLVRSLLADQLLDEDPLVLLWNNISIMYPRSLRTCLLPPEERSKILRR